MKDQQQSTSEPDSGSGSLPAGSVEPCPKCQALLPVNPGFTKWCDRCGWNLDLDERLKPKDLFEALYLAAGRRLSGVLFDTIRHESLLAQPRLSLNRVLAYALATLTHAFTLSLGVAGVWLLVVGMPRVILTFLGIVCLGAFWLLSPRIPRRPQGACRREHFPATYTVLDRLAQTMGARRVADLHIDESFNASYALMGWRQQPVVHIGLPLFIILAPQERIALLAHELAHGINGDASRSLYIGSAIETLLNCHDFLRHSAPGESEGNGSMVGFMVYLSTWVGYWLGLALSYLPRGLAWALSHQLWHDKQRAEYLADLLAARVAGKDATISLLEKCHFEGMFNHVVQTMTLNKQPEPLSRLLAVGMAALPERERERLRRVAKLDSARLDLTHPPTPYRIELLRQTAPPGSNFELSSGAAQEIEKEFFKEEVRVKAQLTDAYLSSLYA